MQVLITWVLILSFVSQCLCLRWKNDENEITSYNVVDYGATGDGQIDDSEALLKAWQKTCETQGAANLVIPSNKSFLVKNIILGGPCEAKRINFQLQGKIVAPPRNAWKSDETYVILFSKVNSLTINGNGGLIDGTGSTWWSCSDCQRPLVIKFSGCNNLVVNYLRMINSPKAHIKISDTVGATFSGINIQAPGNSPNTDGIDISASKNIVIKDSKIATGDDCVAIVNGCSYINISGIDCGPGHGISIGSLGRNNAYATVEEVHVRNCSFNETQNGARIKTWEGASGYARKISFEQITLKNVKNPIIINQNYIERDMGTSLKISDVTYRGFKGTSSNDLAINLDCSSSGCFNIKLDEINIVYPEPGKRAYASCKNAHGTATSTFPNVTCLLK